MDGLTLICDDCGGTGADPGSLHEPEECLACHGGGRIYVTLDPTSSPHGVRKPLGRELVLTAATVADFKAPRLLGGDR